MANNFSSRVLKEGILKYKNSDGLCGKICGKWISSWFILSDKYIAWLSSSQDDGPDDMLLID